MENILEITNKRWEIYEFLSCSYLNIPTEEIIKIIKDKSSALEVLAGDDTNFMKGKNLKDFTQEYYDRFFVPTAKLYVPPYEAAIRNKKEGNGKMKYGKLDSPETFHVKACYEMVDFKVHELNGFKPLLGNSFPDHIAFELSFMTYLVSLEKSALESGNDENAKKWRKLQKDFLTEHPFKWFSEYARLSNEKGKGLYSYLNNISANWIEADLAYLIDEDF